VHVVKKNDTLLGIALRYGVELNDLLAANPGINPRILSIGQEIVIPGPAGDAEGSFFPTPTPVVFDLGDTRCYWDQSGRLICLSTARNPGPQALESVAAMISLADAAGNPLVSRPAYAPLNLLPAQGVAPLHTVFLGLPRQDIRISAWPLSAFLASDVDKRYLSVAVELGSRRALEGGRAWSVEGDLHLQEEFPEGSARLSVLLVGLDAEGRVVAFRTKVWMLEPGEQGPWPFTLTLISLGPPIESLEAYAEGVILP
jgi:LysM repeat protein